MKARGISFFEAVWDYFSNIGALNKLFFFEPSITWENNKPLIKLDIDSGEIDWQPFG